MKITTIIVSLCVMISLLGFPAKVIAEPLKIVSKEEIKVYAFKRVLETWGSKQWDYFDRIIEKESRWNSKAQNPNSTAFGLAQFLDSTWITVGCKKTSNEYTQIDCAIKYIDKRYGTPEKALAHHLKVNWY